MTPFDPSTTQLTTFEKRYDQDGKVFLQAVAHGALTAKQPYWIIVNEYGQVTVALSDINVYAYVGVPLAAVDSGDTAWLQIGGYLTGLITASLDIEVGNALNITSGAVADSAADYSGLVAEFAVAVVDDGAATTQTVMLVPERFLCK